MYVLIWITSYQAINPTRTSAVVAEWSGFIYCTLCALYKELIHTETHIHSYLHITASGPQREAAQLCCSMKLTSHECIQQRSLNVPQHVSHGWMRSSINIWDWLSAC